MQSETVVAGVRGWLLVFVIWIAVSPLIGLAYSFSAFDEIERIRPSISMLSDYNEYKYISLALSGVLFAPYGYVTYRMFFVKNENTVRIAIFSMWSFGLLSYALQNLLYVHYSYSEILGFGSLNKASFAFGLAGLILAASAVNLYMSKSVRVRNTYYITPQSELSFGKITANGVSLFWNSLSPFTQKFVFWYAFWVVSVFVYAGIQYDDLGRFFNENDYVLLFFILPLFLAGSRHVYVRLFK